MKFIIFMCILITCYAAYDPFRHRIIKYVNGKLITTNAISVNIHENIFTYTELNMSDYDTDCSNIFLCITYKNDIYKIRNNRIIISPLNYPMLDYIYVMHLPCDYTIYELKNEKLMCSVNWINSFINIMDIFTLRTKIPSKIFYNTNVINDTESIINQIMNDYNGIDRSLLINNYDLNKWKAGISLYKSDYVYHYYFLPIITTTELVTGTTTTELVIKITATDLPSETTTTTTEINTILEENEHVYEDKNIDIDVYVDLDTKVIEDDDEYDEDKNTIVTESSKDNSTNFVNMYYASVVLKYINIIIEYTKSQWIIATIIAATLLICIFVFLILYKIYIYKKINLYRRKSRSKSYYKEYFLVDTSINDI